MRSMRWAGEEPEERARAPDYFVVRTARWAWAVSTVMARAIEARLDAWPRPRWIAFVDLSGSRVRVRAADIEVVIQSTAAQRAADRALRKALEAEEDDASAWG